MKFVGEPPEIPSNGTVRVDRNGSEVDVWTSEYCTEVETRLRGFSPESLTVENLSLEEIFIAVDRMK